MQKENNPFSHPQLYPNHLYDHRDVEIIIKGIRRAVKLTKATSLQLLICTKLRCHHAAVTSSIQMHTGKCSVRYTTFTIFFAIQGSARWGPDSDPDVVVDSSLGVRGV
jgi:hypothetical protein